MKLLLPLEIQDVLGRELRAEGRRECGGILFGEHIGENLFQIAGITKQKDGGTNSHFVRDPMQHADQLDQFSGSTAKTVVVSITWENGTPIHRSSSPPTVVRTSYQ